MFPREGPPSDWRELRRVRVSVILARRLPRSGGQPGLGALRAPLKTLEIFITGSRRHPAALSRRRHRIAAALLQTAASPCRSRTAAMHSGVALVARQLTGVLVGAV